MIDNTPIVFEKDPNIDQLAQEFAGGQFFSEEALANNIPLHPHAKILIASIRGRIVGAIMYRIIPDLSDSMLLHHCFVEVIPSFRRKKIGTGLLKKVEELYRGEISQISGSVVGSNISSQKMFMNAGFQCIDHNRYIKVPKI